MIHLKKHILTLVALLAVTTQAWAGVIFTSLKVGDVIHVGDQLSFSENWGHDNFLIPSPAPPFTLMRANLEKFDPFAAETHVTPDEDGAYYVFQIYSNGEFSYDLIYDARFPVTANSDGLVVTNIVTSGMHKDYTFAVHEAYPVPVAWNADTKTGTIAAMPAGNVIVNVEYYQDAAFAMSTGTTPMALAPTANNSARANTDDPLVTGGEVANIVEGTEALEAKQGTLMYYFDKDKATTKMTAADLEELTADKWSDKVPTADGLRFDAATDIYVYYYIKGADDVTGLADGVKHTFSDTDPVSLTVSVQPEPTYKVELNAEGLTTTEVANWKAAKGETTPAAFPLTGLKKDDKVTVTYSGSRKVIGLKAEKCVLLNISSPAFGHVIGIDGKNYAYDALPPAVTAVAMICHVDGEHGLALALADEGQMNWEDAMKNAAAHKPAFIGSTWKLPTMEEWDKMISAAGRPAYLRSGFSEVGGNDLLTKDYWSSTEDENNNLLAKSFNFLYSFGQSNDKTNGFYVRACLAF